MRYILIFLLFCSTINIVWGNDTIVSFHGSEIKLPSGYIEFSEDQLHEFRSKIFDRQIMTVYENSYELPGLERFIIYYDSLDGTSNLTFDEIVKIKLEVIKEDGVEFNDVKIDKVNNCVYGIAIIQSDTTLFGFSIDLNGIMGVQLGSIFGIDNQKRRTFEKLLISIKHQFPYQYIPREIKEEKEAKEEMEHHGLNLTIALVAMILILLIRKYGFQKK